MRGIVRVLAPAVLLLQAGCGLQGVGDYWFGETEGPPLPGERVAVMLDTKRLEPDSALQDTEVTLPPAVRNDDWPQAGGYPNHAMQHLSAAGGLKKAWEVSAGEGTGSAVRLTAQPIVAGSSVYTMDVDSTVRAFEVASGKRLWATSVLEEEEEGAFGGGVAYYDGRLYVTTGFAQVVSLDAGSGKELWRVNLPGPMRAAPTVAGGRVFAVTIDNQLHALTAADGEKLWSHAGITEVAGLLGGASPAVEGDIVVAAYSSGEIAALRVENGRPVWADSLAAIRRVDALSNLADIRGNPVIDRGRVYAVSHSGRMVSIDLRSGGRAWDRAVGGVNTPWVAGDYVYVLSNDSRLFCLTRSAGRVRWVVQLPRVADAAEEDSPTITWTGPVLASDRLILSGTHGKVLSISPYTGDTLGVLDLGEGMTLPPLVAGDSIYFLTDYATLVALR